MQTKTLTSRDDLGFVDRRDEGKACEGPAQRYCAVIDDASVYFKTMSTTRQDAIFTEAMTDAPGYPGLPTGRIPAFYRCLIIQRLFQSFGNRNPTLGEMVRILEIVDGASRGGRFDDAWATNTLVRAVLGLKLATDEAKFVETYSGLSYKDSKGKTQGGGDGGTPGGGGGGAQSALPLILGAAAIAAVLVVKGMKR